MRVEYSWHGPITSMADTGRSGARCEPRNQCASLSCGPTPDRYRSHSVDVIMHPAHPGESVPASDPDLRERPGNRARIWRLQYGPCWCQTRPSDTAAFDFARLRTTSADLGRAEENLLIVSGRVIDGTKQVFRQLYVDVPEPKIVISAATCPAADLFWEELPVGWTPVGEILPVDVHVEECVSGNPEELLAAVLSHFLVRERSPHPGAEERVLSLDV